MTFFLGSSNSKRFYAINGYYYKAVVNTEKGTAFVATTDGVEGVIAKYGGLETIHVASLRKSLKPTNATINTLDCSDKDTPKEQSNIDWESGDYSFAEHYAVWGWFRASAADCDKDQVVIRLVIDTKQENKSCLNYTNPNFVQDTGKWSPDFAALGNNVLVAKIVDKKLALNTYTFGIQESSGDKLVDFELSSAVDPFEWYFLYMGYDWTTKKAEVSVTAGQKTINATASARHILPQFIGAYLGSEY